MLWLLCSLDLTDNNMYLNKTTVRQIMFQIMNIISLQSALYLVFSASVIKVSIMSISKANACNCKML